MKNAVHEGNTIPVTAPAGGLTKGVPHLLGALLVVPLNTVAENEQTTGYTEGVYTCAKATGEAWGQGALVYWDDGNSRFTTTAGANTLKGHAFADAGSADTTGQVRLNQ